MFDYKNMGSLTHWNGHRMSSDERYWKARADALRKFSEIRGVDFEELTEMEGKLRVDFLGRNDIPMMETLRKYIIESIDVSQGRRLELLERRKRYEQK